jgi:hypothetical protein
MHNARVDLDDLAARQRFSLWLDGHPGLHTPQDAARFMSEVALALRYNASIDLPLASMYRATQRQVPGPEEEKVAHARAFDLTNSLLARGEAVEINIIANRLALACPRLMPAIYALRRGRDEPRLSDLARQTFEFIAANQTASSGDVRRCLNVGGRARPDPADLALAELQRELFVDRGPSSTPTHGIFYLTRDGYPYRVLALAHPDIPSAAARLDRSQACLELLETYLRAAVFVPPRKLHTLFQLLLSRAEIDATISALIDMRQAERVRLGRTEVVVSHAASA